LKDEYFIERKLYPNVDFYSGIILRALIIPTSMFTVLFALARSRGLPIVYSTTEIRKEVDPDSVRATNRRGKEAPAAYQIRAEFAPQPGDLVIYKERASVFFGTPLVPHLLRQGVDSLIVCGESTSGCVRASAVDAYSYGFHVVLVEECCFDRSLLSHKVNLFDLHHKYADVMHLDEVRKHLERVLEVA